MMQGKEKHMVRRRTLTLTDDERQELIQHRNHDPRPQVGNELAMGTQQLFGRERELLNGPAVHVEGFKGDGHRAWLTTRVRL